MTQHTRRAGLRERLGDGIAAGRLVRVSLVTAFVVLVLAGGATALWVSVDPVGPERTASRVDPPAAQPALRLDTLPAPRGAPPGPEGTGDAKAAPVIGVGSGEFAEPEASKASEGVVEVDGEKPIEEIATDAEVKEDLAALERENARIEAALAGGGAGMGTGRLIWPVRGGRTTSPFGPRGGRLHAGVDIAVPIGTDVYAADTGRVAISGPTGGYGNYICIQHTRSLSTCYGHNSRLGVRKGESVRKGSVIAKSGNTGNSTGPHVHFETRVGGKPVNPMRYF
ncbi:MAG TPA: M23 family metallopeptidase [Acetobacteraceae bacterium]|nr:M23 family metallopeptidase [Acetobacteraceae bacterium]